MGVCTRQAPAMIDVSQCKLVICIHHRPTGRLDRRARGGGDGHAGGQSTRKLNALTPLNFHCQRHGDSVFCLPSDGPLLANETRVCLRLKVDAAMFGRETRRKRRWAHSQVTARDGRQGKAREGINWRCSLNTNVAWRTRPPPPPTSVAGSIRGTISHRHSARELAVAHTRADDRPPRPPVTPSVSAARGRTPTTHA